MKPEDKFAQHLADGKTIPEIRKIMNLTNGAAQGMMFRIRGGLGAQAI